MYFVLRQRPCARANPIIRARAREPPDQPGFPRVFHWFSHKPPGITLLALQIDCGKRGSPRTSGLRILCRRSPPPAWRASLRFACSCALPATVFPRARRVSLPPALPHSDLARAGAVSAPRSPARTRLALPFRLVGAVVASVSVVAVVSAFRGRC